MLVILIFTGKDPGVKMRDMCLLIRLLPLISLGRSLIYRIMRFLMQLKLFGTVPWIDSKVSALILQLVTTISLPDTVSWFLSNFLFVEWRVFAVGVE